jgi:tetratricopeptide (TPR) repeat protein
MKGIIVKLICSLFLCVFIFAFIEGCSMNTMLSWMPFGNADEKDVAQFVSNVRPPRENPDSHYQLGLYYQERGRHREAIEEFEKAILIDPMYVKAFNGMGASYDMLGDYSKAIYYYKRALTIEPDLDYVLNNLGYSYILQNNPDEAITALKKAIELNGQESRYRNNLALAYSMKGQFDHAMNELRLSGDETEAQLKIANLYYRQGVYEEAKKHYEEALTLEPSSTDAKKGIDASAALAKISQGMNVVKTEGQIKPYPKNTKKRENLVAQTIDYLREMRPYLRKSDIEIANGNGVSRMAKTVGNYLKERGLRVTWLTNADNFNHAETRIYYREGNSEVASYISEQIPGDQAIEESRIPNRPQNIKVKVIIGKDLISYKKAFKRG